MHAAEGPSRVATDVYLVGDSDITDSKDCSVYLLDLNELILVDTGAGVSSPQITRNIELLGLDPRNLSTLILTHCHIDHVGGASYFKERFGAKVIMHERDAGAVERGDRRMTAAYWYNIDFYPLEVDVKLTGREAVLETASGNITWLHTPGHTPGSISLYLDRGGERILFGQDIHGPFLPEFGADLTAWHRSMERLLALEADILCEGHFGVYRTKERVRAYIERYMEEYS